MAPMVDATSYELHFLGAAADGVEPALLLKAPGKKAEYLFNVPDGFSRLALEHKSIPSARLSCVLLTSLLPPSTGGLGGLILRLKHDGHGQFQMVGPQGSSRITHSLRHIFRWQHPKVIVSECCANGPLPMFEDEHIVIVPLLAGDQSTGCPWCLYASPGTSTSDPPKKIPQTTFEQHDDSSSSSDCTGSSSSSDDSRVTQILQPTSEEHEGDSFEKRLRMFSTSSQKGKDVQSKDLDAAGRLNSQPSNGASVCSMPPVRGHPQGEGSDLKQCESILPQRRKREEVATKQPVLELEEAFFGHVKSELDKARMTKPIQHSGRVFGVSKSGSSLSRNKEQNCNTQMCCDDLRPGTGDVQSSLLGLTPNLCPGMEVKEGHPGSLSCNHFTQGTEFEGCSELQRTLCSTSMVDCDNPQKSTLRCDVASGLEETSVDVNLKTSAARGSRITDLAEDLLVHAGGVEHLNVHPMKPYDWHVSNLQRNELPELADESNPVYRLSPSGHLSVISSLEIGQNSRPKSGSSHDSYEGQPPRVLGYVCYLRKLNEAVLVVDCRGVKCLESLRRHPTLSCIYHASGGCEGDETNRSGRMHIISAVVHFTPHSLVHSSDYQTWMHSFTSPVHVVRNDRSPEFGFQSSLATLKRLNNIHQDIFPLPPTINSSQRTRKPMQVLTKSNVMIVDAELSMVLNFTEESTTLSYASVDFSLSPYVKQRSSLREASEQSADWSIAKVNEQRPGVSDTAHLTVNALAAAGIKRRLLTQRESFFPTDKVMQSRKTMSNDVMAAMHTLRNCNGQDGTGKNCSHPMITAGNQDSSNDIYNHVDRTFNVYRGGARQNVPCDKEKEYFNLFNPASEFQLIFLGTGCAEPSKKRGSSGILLQVRGAQGSMLLDAGEGAAGQLFRRFGEQGARTIISSLQCLWLSHKHGDHVLGVLSILDARSTHRAPPLMVIGPHKVGQWLSEVRDTRAATEFPLPQFTYVHCDDLSDSEKYRNNQQHARQLLGVLDAMQLQSMRSVKVFHCYDAYGIILNGRCGWRVVYSGDTRPCKQLIEAGWGCTVLIHEATFEDSLLEQAQQKRHSTVSEAVQVGLHMQARHIILTHFSQRYPEMVAINGDHLENLSLAFDGMVVASGQLDSLGKLLPRIRIACQKTVKVSPITNSGKQRSEGLSMSKPIWHCESRPAVEEKTVACVDTSVTKDPLHGKHWRWLSDSDHEAEVQCLESHPIATSIRWSSDSDEETRICHQGFFLPTEDGSRDPTSEMTSGFCKNGVGPLNLQEVGGVNYTYMGTRASSDISETCGPLGGKHLRWNDCDSDDG